MTVIIIAPTIFSTVHVEIFLFEYKRYISLFFLLQKNSQNIMEAI